MVGVVSPELFQKYRFYVACEADEDVAYLSQYIGEDNLIIGSDYGHNDPSEEGDLVRQIRAREDIPARIAREFFPIIQNGSITCEHFGRITFA